jgi:ATP-binding cassette, subfamily A (ABC1), member 3
MAEGQIRCAGTSLFLKKTYGVGYQLTIEKKKSSSPQSGREGTKELVESYPERFLFDDNNQQLVVQLNRTVQKAVPDATLLSDVGSEIIYHLPLKAAPSFASLFRKIEDQIETGAITSYGVSITTLNEVFVLVTKGFVPGMSNEGMDSLHLLRNSADQPDSTELSPNLSEGWADLSTKSVDDAKDLIDFDDNRLFMRHMIALMKKRGLYFRRDKKAWICTTIVPSVFVLVGFLIFVYASPLRNMGPLTLDLKDYNPGMNPQEVPITFNAPGPENPFLCQPSVCSHRETIFASSVTNELYVFCGYESSLAIGPGSDGMTPVFAPKNQTCSISNTESILRELTDDVVTLDEATVSNISQVSR